MASKIRKTALGASIAFVSVGTLVLSGCSGAGSEGGEYSGEIQVNVYGDWPFVQENADAFMELHPEATITVGGITNDDLRQSGGRLFTSDDSPDVVSYTLQPSLMEEWISAGALLPLDDLWDSEGIEDVVSSTTTEIATAADGSRYSAPIALTQTPYVFYNKDAWTAAGATLPDPDTHEFASMEEFNDSLQKVKDAGYIPFSVPGSFVEYQFNAHFASSCGNELYEEIATNWQQDGADSAKYTEQCAVNAIQQLVDWAEAGYYSPGLDSLTFEQAQTLFDTQEAATWIMGSWVPVFYDPADFEWDWALFPSVGETPPAHGIGIDSFLVPAGAKNPELAKSFISFMMEKETIEDGMGKIPAREDTDLTKVIDSDINMSLANAAAEGDRVPYWSTTATVSQEEAFAQHVVSGAMAGSMTAEEAAARLQDTADEYREQHQ